MSYEYQVPATPRVISPSPTPSEAGSRDGYFPSQSRGKYARGCSVEPIDEQASDHLEDDPELDRARSRSRSPKLERKSVRHTNGGVTTSAKVSMSSAAGSNPTRRKKEADTAKPPNGDAKGLLSPASAYVQGQGFGSAYWRNLSRSPSPFGLIPIHREWQAFVHRHEVPRKVLHVSIGFLTLSLYLQDVQPTVIHPILLGALIPILTVDLIRFRWPAFNRLYIRVMGAFMRESEAHDRFNGVISYLAGAWFTMRFCRKDVAVMSVLLLSWCDTAASTFGRLWGKYTPRIRRGKSLAGSLAAFTVGVGTAVLFWGVIAPRTTGTHDEGINAFAFNGHLTLPFQARQALDLSSEQATISGPLAIGVLSVASGLVASVSEAIDLWGLDDNLTIPVFCSLGLGVILWAFGGS